MVHVGADHHSWVQRGVDKEERRAVQPPRLPHCEQETISDLNLR